MRRSPAYGLLVRCLSPLPQCALRGVSTIAAAAALDVQLSTQRDRKTKVVCTIGPATVDRIPDLILAGMDVARINCAHGSPSSYATIVNNVRLATDRIRQEGIRPTDVERADCASVAIAFDIKGPEIRTGQFNDTVPTNKIASTDAKGVISYAIGNKEIMVKAGDTLTLTCNPELAAAGTPGLVYINYAHLAAQARPGQLVYIDDGNVELVVTSVDAAHSSLTAISRTTAPLGERKGVNLPGLLVDLPHVTKKDEADIALARSLGADFLFASFVQSAEMVRVFLLCGINECKFACAQLLKPWLTQPIIPIFVHHIAQIAIAVPDAMYTSCRWMRSAASRGPDCALFLKSRTRQGWPTTTRYSTRLTE